MIKLLVFFFVLQLVLAGIVDQELGVSFMSDILLKAITSDQKSKTYSFVSVVTSFARQFADDFAGILPRKYKVLYTKYQLVPPQTKASFICLSISTHID